MGVWDYISGTTDSLKRNAPDLTSVKNWCSISYDYSKAGVSNVHNAVKVNAGKVVGQYWPSEETRSEISRIATNFVLYSAEEGLKQVPGGASVHKVGKRLFHDVNKAEDVKALRARVERLEKESGQNKKNIEQTMMMMMNKQSCSDVTSSKTPNSDSNSVLDRKPEDVIRVFMMKDFMGRQFLDDLLVPGASPRKK